MSSAGVERRSAPRHRIPVRIRFQPSGGEEQASVVHDLSESGVSFVVPRRLGEGTLVNVSFPLGDEEFRLNAAVAWCRETPAAGTFRVGLYFLRPSMAFRLRLSQQIEEIRELRRELALMRGEEVSLEDAAHEWVEFAAGNPAARTKAR
jgi:hypothetical protein